MATVPSGKQYELTLGDQQATIVEVGGGVRDYRHGDRDVLHGYDIDAMCDGAHGAPLVPWPNRIADGRYTWDGADQQVPLSEPEKNNAIHGFLRWRSWSPTDRSPTHVVMATTMHALKGYPFSLDVTVCYELTEAGLVVSTGATNIGTADAPFACGQHPYLSPGTGVVDDCTLTFSAATRIDTDDERQLPTGQVPVAGTVYDVADGRPLGSTAIDYAFTDVARDDAGRAWVSLTGADGRTVDLWVGPDYPIVEIYTADTLSADRRRGGLGVEPMTAPPNAFATGEQLVRLAPGDSVVRTWGVGLRAT